MLRFTINKNNLKEYEEKLPIEEIKRDGEMIIIKTTNPHGLRSGEYINFKRTNIKGEEIFNELVDVNVNDSCNFSVENFKPLTLNIDSCELVDVYSPISGEIKAIKFTLNDVSNILINRGVVENSTIPNELNTPIYKRRCCGDLVNYNNIFLLKSSRVENNKYIEYDGHIYNTFQKIIFKKESIKIEFNVMVPLTPNGEDNDKILYWFFNEDDEYNANILLTLFREGIFSYEDTRFIKENDENRFIFRKDFSGNTDAYIFQMKNVLDIDFKAKEGFDVSLLKNDYYKDFYVEQKVNEHINKIVDMEKQIFFPKLETNDSNCVVDGIKIKVNIRKRNTDDEENWPNAQIKDEWYKDGKNDKTTITDIGFSESDIIYQKNSLKKSFLRLSFYDTKHRGTQKLLYYSTVFLDANKIFGDKFYFNKISELNFTIKNSHDYFSCSEGYYLYLFPKLAKKDEETTIYMKVEFNHAKYGKTLALVMPTDDDYKKGYTNKDTKGTTGIEKLFNDLYIKVKIKYDSINNKYVWYIPNCGNNIINDYNNNEIIMTLYEPIVYKSN